MFFTDRVSARLLHEANMRALQKAQERERDAVEEFRKAQAERLAINDVDHLRQHVKELQDLLAKEKDRSDMFRKQRDELQRRIDLLGDILEGFDPNA